MPWVIPKGPLVEITSLGRREVDGMRVESQLIAQGMGTQETRLAEGPSEKRLWDTGLDSKQIQEIL